MTIIPLPKMNVVDDLKFKSFVSADDFDNNCVAFITTRDDQLDINDYRIDCIIISNGRVVKQVIVKKSSAYALENMIGLSIEQICEWSEVDNTGSSPETWNMVAIIK